MNLILTGMNHRTAPVEVRERMNVSESRMAAALADLVSREGIQEGVILSTCNRVEVVVNADSGADAEPVIRRFLTDYHHCNIEAFEQHFYWQRQEEAVEHLFRVAASLDSMILGEPQILGQVKQALAIAREAGALRGELYEVMSHAVAVGRRVRRETALGSAAISVSYAAVELAKKIFGSLEEKTVFVLGAGKMSELAAQHLATSGAGRILVANRTYERAAELAAALHGEAAPFDQLFNILPRADIVLSSTGSPHYLIHREHVERALAARKNRPMFFVDIAVPRDIDPAVNDLENAFVYDIDDLGLVVESNKKQRERESAWAEEIVRQEAQKMMRRLASRDVAPTILALEKRLSVIRERELERFRGRMSTMSPVQREAVDELTQAILNKILHGPITELKTTAGHAERGTLAQTLRKIFGVTE